jgi:hypothetical protein
MDSQQGPHSCADSCANSASKLQEGLAILQGLVFELRRDLDDLRFRMEILDGKETQFLQMLSALQGVFHPSAGEANATEVEPPILAPAPHGTTEEEATPVEEEATPLGDPMPNATSMDVWPHYKPTT